jgi:hypothetical protein
VLAVFLKSVLPVKKAPSFMQPLVFSELVLGLPMLREIFPQGKPEMMEWLLRKYHGLLSPKAHLVPTLISFMHFKKCFSSL